MRHFATISPAFWTGHSGKAITAAGKDARILATYLLTCEHSNMFGLYRLPLLYAQEETGLKRKEVEAAFSQLRAIDFACYDCATDHVWVLEMARFQLGLIPGEALKETDYRRKGAGRLYRQMPSNPFLGPFFDRYAGILGLPLRRDFSTDTKPVTSPIQGASEPLRRPDVLSFPVSYPRKGDRGETNGPLSVDVGFDDFWTAYPRKTGKKDAREAWAKLKPDAVLVMIILTAVGQQKQCSDWQKESGRFIPYPATWLNGRRWEDEGVSLPAAVSAAICTKQVQRGQFLKPCGAPAAPDSPPDEPRCLDHLAGVAERNGHGAH